MARSLSQAKLIAESVADGFSLFINRRGYAAASHASVSARFGSGGSRSRMMGKLEERAGIKEDSGASSSWAPDPVSGYYRPINHATEIDAVELRKLLLNNKVRPQ
ncbi:late embryogenesis abundant protein Lea5-like [Fagus crenata]